VSTLLDVAREPCCFAAFVWYTVLYKHAMVVAACICFQHQRRCVPFLGNAAGLALDALEYLCKCTYMPLALQHFSSYFVGVILQQFSSGMLVVSST
jgi:hypothetical protein